MTQSATDTAGLAPASGGPPAVARSEAHAHEPLPETKSRTIEVTAKAASAVKRQLDKRGTPDAALRIGLKGGGCSGFTYVIEFHDGPPRARDVVLTAKTEAGEDVRVVVDPKSLLYLSGSTLEWEHTLMKQGFKFINPHEKSSCGCGHSFDV